MIELLIKKANCDNWKVKVHSLNVIREMVKNTILSGYIHDYLSDIFILATNGFNSDIWNVKNSSMMLFTAITMRTVGGNRYQTSLNDVKELFTFNQFFNIYPKWYEFILNYLTNVAEKNDYSSSSLYPLLLLISYLSPNSLDIESIYSTLNYFKIITLFGQSKNDMIRIVTSRAIV